MLHQGEYEQIHTLDLDVSYKSLLQVEHTEEVVRGLTDARLGRDFAVRAVHVLSSHPVRLAGINMICESARMKRLHDAIAGDWDTGASFTMQLLDYIKNWEKISRALLVWKDHSYEAWVEDEQLERIGIKSPEEALDVVHLVCRVPIRGKELERRPKTRRKSWRY